MLKNAVIMHYLMLMASYLFINFREIRITSITKSGLVNILEFKDSAEYKYLKELFEDSFLNNQLKALEKAG
jgi:hypothetical protein